MINELNTFLGTFAIGALTGLVNHILIKQNITLERVIDIFFTIFIGTLLNFLASLNEVYGFIFGIILFLLINEKLPHFDLKEKKVVKK